MFNFGGGAGPGNSGMFQGALSSTRGITPEDMNRLIEAYRREGKPLPPNLNPPQGTNPRPLAVGTPSMDMIGNVEGMKMAHGIHTPTTVIDGVPRYLDKGSHDPSQHNAPVDPSGKPIPELKPRDEDIRLLSGTVFPVGNYINKTVS